MKFDIPPFLTEISKYDTKTFVNAFSQLNLMVYKNRLETGSAFLEIDLRKYGIWNMRSPWLHINHWSIRDIILQKCMRPRFDDSFGIRQSIDMRQMIKVILMYNHYENCFSKNGKNRDKIFYTMFGLMEQQGGCQTNNYQWAFRRNQIIFEELDRETKYFKLDDVFYDMFDMSYNEFMIMIFTVVSIPLTQNTVHLKEYPNGYFQVDLQIQDFEMKFLRVIDYYTGGIDKIQQAELHLARYKYPFVEIDGNNVLIDCFMFQEKFRDAVIWIAREYYRKNEVNYGKNYFPNSYGELFERYIEKTCSESRCNFKLLNLNKLENESVVFKFKLTKKADYLIETRNYRLVLECKSGIRSVYTKDAYNNVEHLYKFFDKIFDRGAQQALDTVMSLHPSHKIDVCFIVHSEEAIFKSRVKRDYLSDVRKEYLGEVLLIDILEFEIWVSILKEDEELAEEIMSNFIQAQQKGDLEDLINILNRKASHIKIQDLDEKLLDFERYLKQDIER